MDIKKNKDMQVPVGEYSFMIDAYLTDFRGKATLPMIGGFMLQAATKHAEERCFGYSVMTSQGKVWVLSRMAIEIFDYPKNDTAMKVYTWITEVNKLFTERCFAFKNSNGKIIGYAKSVWAAIDMNTRRPTNILEINGLSEYIYKENVCPIEGFKKVPPLKDSFPAGNFVIKYSDVDINKHLNSMKYIEHFIDIFDITMFKEKEIGRFEINYITEAHYGTTIEIINKEHPENIFSLEMKNKEKVVSASRITWI